jgi:hypothetical protein
VPIYRIYEKRPCPETGLTSVCKNLILWAVWPQNWLHPSSVHAPFPLHLPFTPYGSPYIHHSSPHFHSHFPHPLLPLSFSPIPPPFSIFLYKIPSHLSPPLQSSFLFFHTRFPLSSLLLPLHFLFPPSRSPLPPLSLYVSYLLTVSLPSVSPPFPLSSRNHLKKNLFVLGRTRPHIPFPSRPHFVCKFYRHADNLSFVKPGSPSITYSIGIS